MVEDFIVKERSLYRELGKLADPGVRKGERKEESRIVQTPIQ
jgi:hypothetical protein